MVDSITILLLQSNEIPSVFFREQNKTKSIPIRSKEYDPMRIQSYPEVISQFTTESQELKRVEMMGWVRLRSMAMWNFYLWWVAVCHGPVEIVSFPIKSGDFPYVFSICFLNHQKLIRCNWRIMAIFITAWCKNPVIDQQHLPAKSHTNPMKVSLSMVSNCSESHDSYPINRIIMFIPL